LLLLFDFSAIFFICKFVVAVGLLQDCLQYMYGCTGVHISALQCHCATATLSANYANEAHTNLSLTVYFPGLSSCPVDQQTVRLLHVLPLPHFDL